MHSLLPRRWRRLATLLALLGGVVLLAVDLPFPAAADPVQTPRPSPSPSPSPSASPSGSSSPTVARGVLQPADPTSGPQGIDVSRYQGSVDWHKVRGSGIQFTYVKATEGQQYVDASFEANAQNAARAGVLRGAYHFARPDRGSGKDQANHLVNHGGGWKNDGKTLPAAVDMEWNPAGPTCYGMSEKQIVSWLWDFVNQYHARAGRWPVIYTPAVWWDQCTGGYSGFEHRGTPLWQSTLGNTPHQLARGWTRPTFWQYDQRTTVPGIPRLVDVNVFNGSTEKLHELAAQD
ncbi:MAG: lysozyme [bacterium]|nr:lysozyme [bacterium]